MIIPSILIIVGFACLIFGANWLVNGASSLAKKFHISELVIGLTIVALGTSAPELVVNSVASFNGFSDIVFGNIIGSNNFNLFIMLGVAGLIYPLTVQKSTINREIPMSLIGTILLVMLANDFFMYRNTEVSRMDSVFLLLAFTGFLYYMRQNVKKGKAVAEVMDFQSKSNSKIWLLIIIGVAGLIIGGKMVVDNSIIIATEMGVSQKIIGLTILAVGTSLPELVTAVVAALKKNSDIAIGNVIGSNIFNILLILPISALVNPVQFNQNFNIDLSILMGGTAFLILIMLILKKNKLVRWQALLLLCFYLGYTSYLVSNEL